MKSEEFFSKCISEIAKENTVLDIDRAKKPDIVGDAHDIPLGDGEVDAVLCLSVLEHVRNPLQVVSEIRRVLKPGGKALFFIPFLWPFHGVSDCPDYWRFTHQGIKELFRDFETVEYVKLCGYLETLSNFMPAKTVLRPLSAFLDQIANVGRSSTAGFYVFVVK